MDSMAAMIIRWLLYVDCDISDRSVGGKNIYGVKRQMQGYMKDQVLDYYMCSNPFEDNIR